MVKGNYLPILTKPEIEAVRVLARIISPEKQALRRIVPPERINAIASWAKYNDVVPQILENARSAASLGFIEFEHWTDEFEKACDYDCWFEATRVNSLALPGILAGLAARHIRFIVFKSQDLQGYYGKSSRFQQDIDLIFPDIDAGWTALRHLIETGALIGKVKLGNVQINAGPYSPSLMYLLAPLEVPTFSGKTAKLDLHAGGFPFCGSLALPTMQMFENVKEVWFEDSKCSMPTCSREYAILILCAHITQHWLLTFRDVNDFYALCKHAEVDWEWLAVEAKRTGLKGVLITLAKLVEETYEVDLVPVHLQDDAALLEYSAMLFKPRNYLLVLLERLRYLIATHSAVQGDRRRGFLQGMRDLSYLMLNNRPWYDPINNRPYRVFHRRSVQSLSGSKQVTLYRLPFSLGNGSLAQAQKEVQDLFAASNNARSLSPNCVVINEKEETEIVANVAGLFTQCGYQGQITSLERALLTRVGDKLLSTIQQ